MGVKYVRHSKRALHQEGLNDQLKKDHDPKEARQEGRRLQTSIPNSTGGKMIEHITDFRAWFRNLLHPLYDDHKAGLVILMVVFPLLERYVRQRARIPLGQNLLCKEGKTELLQLIPELQDAETAGYFWEVFRHGLLHQVSLFPESKMRSSKPPSSLPASRITQDIPVAFAIEPDRSFTLNPALFAELVFSTIENDFETFVGHPASSYPLLKTEPRTVPTGMTGDYPNYYLGTSCSKRN